MMLVKFLVTQAFGDNWNTKLQMEQNTHQTRKVDYENMSIEAPNSNKELSDA